jgi:type IV pilus assembly protein PilA
MGEWKMKNAAQKGFTLIELMIVIAIVGILAAVALPAYQDYTIRAKMAETLAALGEAKTSVSEYYIATGSMPANNTAAGLRGDINTEIVASVTYASSVITAKIKKIGGDTALNQTVLLSMVSTASGAPTWTCVAGTIAVKYLPANCRG